MSLATYADIRALANWNAAVSDSLLAPHLAGAAREFKRWCDAIDEGLYAALGDVYGDPDAGDVACAVECEAALAIALALPSMNAFVLAQGPYVPKAVDDPGFTFLTPEQVAQQQAIWRARAHDRFTSWDWTEPDEEAGETEDNLPRSPWSAI